MSLFFLFDPFQTLNPIPIGNEFNQPIYSYHMTHASRNRVKAEIRNKNCWFIEGIEDTQFSLWNFLTFSLQPAIIGESLIIFSHLKLTETCHFISFSFSCRWKTCQSKLLTHVGGVNKNYFFLRYNGKTYFFMKYFQSEGGWYNDRVLSYHFLILGSHFRMLQLSIWILGI